MIDQNKDFSGATYVRELDHGRLTEQLRVVYSVMRDGAWRTVEELAHATKFLNSRSLEAQIRNLRKPEFGGFHSRLNPDGHFVLRRNRGEIRGLSEYRLLLSREFRRADAPKSLMEAYEQELARQNSRANGPAFREGSPAPREKAQTRPQVPTDLFSGELFGGVA